MVFEKLNEFFGDYAMRLFWKLFLVYVALTLLRFPAFTQTFLDYELFGLPLFKGRVILAILCGISAWLIHRHQL